MSGKLSILSGTLLLTPLLAFADPAITDANFDWITSVVEEVGSVVADFIPLLIGIALLVFIWGVVRFISSDDDSGRSDGKKRIIWGLVGLFVIVSVWGLVLLIQTLIGIEGASQLDANQLPTIPAINTGDAAAVE